MRSIVVIHGQFIQAVDFVVNTDVWVCIGGNECSDNGWSIALKSYLHFPQAECIPGLVMGDGAQKSSTTVVEFCAFLKGSSAQPSSIWKLYSKPCHGCAQTFSNKGAVLSLTEHTVCLVIVAFIFNTGWAAGIIGHCMGCAWIPLHGKHLVIQLRKYCDLMEIVTVVLLISTSTLNLVY